jgi:hypothetical protein
MVYDLRFARRKHPESVSSCFRKISSVYARPEGHCKYGYVGARFSVLATFGRNAQGGVDYPFVCFRIEILFFVIRTVGSGSIKIVGFLFGRRSTPRAHSTPKSLDLGRGRAIANDS